MQLLIKKIYCPSCQRLVKGREQKVNNNRGILCSRCSRLLRVWNGIIWMYVREKG